ASLQPVPVSNELVFDDSGLSALKWGGPVTGGGSHDTTLGTSQTATTATLRIAADGVRVTEVEWDIRVSGNYELRLTWSGSSANSYNTLWAGVVAAAGAVTVVLDELLVLQRGQHFLTLVRTNGAGLVYARNATAYGNGDV